MSDAVPLLAVHLRSSESYLLRDALLPERYQIIEVVSRPALYRHLAHRSGAIVVVGGAAEDMAGALATCAAVRKRSVAPLAILGGDLSPVDIVQGLEGGADDVIDVDGLNLKVLRLRIDVLLRRTQQRTAQQHIHYRVGNVVLNATLRTVTVGGTPVTLRPLEYRLLYFLIRNPQQKLSKTMLRQKVWGTSSYNRSAVEMAVRRLRKKIERDPSEPEHLITVRGFGYTFL